ncbi:MAG: XRE family transcriptional regulator [Proteobacteria bacterium]|nr:MAG: XRE family transcriptional regulator [Pseudomonadota bacterium]
MGRPAFTIDGARLKDLREAAGKTQLAVAKEIHAQLGKKSPSDDATLANGYQRIERTGNTSRQRAEALATIFNVTVEVLQGKALPDPVDYVANLAACLHKQLTSGSNCALLDALEQITDTRTPSDESINDLARAIAARIEAAQLACNPHELEELSSITGLPETELLNPANVHGHWIIVANGGGVHATELIRGASSLAFRVADIVGDLLKYRGSGSDTSIRMRRDEPWYRLEIRRNAHADDVIRIDLARCEPTGGKGITWAKATWYDRFVFENAIREWAYATANFVTGFDGTQSPSGDVRRLRLRVFEHGQGDRPPTGRMLISGNLDKMPESVFDNFRKENDTHSLVFQWLVSDLLRSLAPYFSEYPRKCWSVRSGGKVIIDLDEFLARKQPITGCFVGARYSIELVEEIAENEYAPVPWRTTDIYRLGADIEQLLADPNHHAWTTDEPRRPFEPCPANE